MRKTQVHSLHRDDGVLMGEVVTDQTLMKGVDFTVVIGGIPAYIKVNGKMTLRLGHPTLVHAGENYRVQVDPELVG